MTIFFFFYACELQSNLSLQPPDKSDHLKIADTHFQSLQFSDSNVRSVFLKMRPPEKCELRTLCVGPKLRFNLGKATKYVKLSEKNFFDRPTFPLQALRTSDHRVCKLDLAWHGRCQLRPRVHVGTTDRWWRWLVRGHVYDSIENFWTKPGKWDHLRNRTTFSQSLRWSEFTGLTVCVSRREVLKWVNSKKGDTVVLD